MTKHRLNKLPGGEPLVDQGLENGFPLTWNPDDSLFYVHKLGAHDGTSVLGRFKEFRNAVQYARRLA